MVSSWITTVFHKLAIDQFCQKYGFHLSEEDMKARVYGRTNKEWLTNLFGELSSGDLQKYAFEKEQLYRDLYGPKIAPTPGLVDFLDLLKSNEVPVAIGTSAPRDNVDFTLNGTNTSHYFETILDETFVSKSKPDPEIYIKVSAALSLPPAQCIVIEDSLSGVKSGLSAGNKVIGITTTHTAEELRDTHLIIDDFHGLNMDVLTNIL